MKYTRTNVTSFFILALLYFVTGHNNIDHKSEANIFGPAIVRGRNASPEKRPFQVLIVWKDLHGHHCGGSVIDSEYVLTAGHCVDGLSPTELVVFAGVLNNTKESSEDTKVEHQVTEILLHEEYFRKTLKNDIAILKVSPAFPTDNPAVKPIPLRKDVAPDGVRCTVSGWVELGNKAETMPHILQVAPMYLLTHEKCRDIYENHSKSNIIPGMICAENLQAGQRIYFGDSGGPLKCGGLLTGIVSGGVDCDSPCFPDVYTDVVYYKEWIEKHIRTNETRIILPNDSNISTLGTEAPALSYDINSTATLDVCKIPGTKIVGGSNARQRDFPYQVSIRQRGCELRHFCGGSIIDDQHVLTAAHCVESTSPGDIRIIAGDVLLDRSSCTSVRRSVSAIFVHENYNASTLQNDIALIRVSKPFPTDSSFIMAIELSNTTVKEGTACNVTGWGETEENKADLPNNLQYVEVPIISAQNCSDHINKYNIRDGMICAGYKEGRKDACQGDSGGPMQCNGYLAGIVSWGIGCAKAGYPGVYTEVSYYMKWINDKRRRLHTTVMSSTSRSSYPS